MKLQIVSDIHLELSKKKKCIIKPLTEILILCGDIGRIWDDNYKKFIKYCSLNWKYVLIVMGNHEYYHSKKSISTILKEYINYFNNFKNIYLLNNSFVIINNIKFIGSTLWSNINCSTKYLSDFKYIQYEYKKQMTTKYYKKLYEESKNYILKESISNIKTILITHFPLINENVCSEEHKNSELLTYFTNDLLKYLNKNIICCIHGHTHYNVDFIKNNIRFISNTTEYDNIYSMI